MKNNTLFHCFLSNLEKDTARKEFMHKQLSELGIIYENLPAVYGASLTTQELDLVYDKNLSERVNKVAMNRGEIGCAATHIKFYEKMCRENIDYALILEDDVLLDKTFKTVIEKEIKKHEASKSWDYLSFDYHAYGLPFLRLWFPGVLTILLSKEGPWKRFLFLINVIGKGSLLLPIVIFAEIQKTIFVDSAISPLWPSHFTGAYLITKGGASKLLSIHNKVLYTSDRLPNIARKKVGLRFKIYSPLLAKQKTEVFTSNISTK